MTPMQEQYEKIKRDYKDYVVLFRLGDFYEAFNEDAETLSRVLGITLTGRGKGEERRPMAGIPHHALSNYLPKLIDEGIRVAIADQMEEPTPGKLVEREVTKVITPGTVIDEKSLDASKNNYIAGIYFKKQGANFATSVAFCDLTTGEFKVFESENQSLISMELSKINPAELIANVEDVGLAKALYKGNIQGIEKSNYDLNKSTEVLKKQFNVKTLKGFGIEEKEGAIIAAGSLLGYIIECQKVELKHIQKVALYNYSDYMSLDFETIRNLELIFSTNNVNQSYTLYAVLNTCINPMGKRKLRNWILNPLLSSERIEERLNCVDYFYKDRAVTGDIRDRLKNIGDIERIVGRIGLGSASPKDLVALSLALENIDSIIEIANSNKNQPKRLQFIIDKLASTKAIEEIKEIINKRIEADPPVIVAEGGVIKLGFNSEVDELRNIRQNSKEILAQIQKREIERTNISSLKISFNQVFGYYIEITKTHQDKVPLDYIRKQTLVNAERYITQELKELEDKILNAEDKLIAIERRIYIETLDLLSQFSSDLLEVCNLIAEVDIYTAFGFNARERRYSRPVVKKDTFVIENGSHPVIEILTQKFVPNSVDFFKPIHILTGPNMSGKSTYIRQVALITLMAQIGSFVPAEKMEFEPVDRIFTRVGASDNLAKGESTFMVEMSETANILNNATKHSLVILDEVGRGTSTYDGVAIAWSIIEFIEKNLGCKTLFATHYHELIDLEKNSKLIQNYNVSVIDEGSEVIFQHRIVTGGASKSYGVHVAKIAGIPTEVIKRANEILLSFEGSKEEKKDNSKKAKTREPQAPKKMSPDQLNLM